MSIKINIYNQQAKVVGEIKLSKQVFGVKPNETLVHQAMVTQMANERQVFAHTKVRSEVSGGGRKPWRQKGTGRARVGSTRSPIWKGGGVTFGPRSERNFKKKLNKKMKQKALLMVLSDKVKHDNMVVLDKLEMGEYKTKIFNEMIKGFEKELEKVPKSSKGEKGLSTSSGQVEKDILKDTKGAQKKKVTKRSVLVIIDKKDEKVKLSGKNLSGVEIININNINILDLLKYRDVILTKKGVKSIEEKHKTK